MPSEKSSPILIDTFNFHNINGICWTIKRYKCQFDLRAKIEEFYLRGFRQTDGREVPHLHLALQLQNGNVITQVSVG